MMEEFGYLFCSFVFLTERKLKEHIKWAHSTINKHTCEYCSKVFMNATSLLHHLKSCQRTH